MYYVRLIKLILFLKDKLCKILKNFWVVENVQRTYKTKLIRWQRFSLSINE